MNLQLANKVVLVTGSSKGIGKQIATSFAGEGATVIINSRNKEESEVVSASINGNTIALAGDMTKLEDCKTIIDYINKKYDRLDTLICNVGSGRSVPPGEETSSEWKRIFDLNFFSATNILEFATPLLKKSKGNITCISSICGSAALGAPVTYSCAKSALNSLVNGLSRPLGKFGVRINGVSPGNILFEGSTGEKKIAEDENNVRNMLKNEVPLNKFGTPTDIANFVLYLSSDLAGFCTGTTYHIDGGQLRI